MQNLAPQLLLSLLVCLSFVHGKQPNILFCISDDQSYAHTGANGDPVVKTPAFDRVAREGIRFTRTFCDAPTCGPSRSAILTGQPIWRLEEAGNLWSTLPKKFITYPEVLAKAGYSVGFTGKACIHPSQVDIINKAFEPTKEEKEEAMKVLKEYEKIGGSGVIKVDGKMVDEPIAEAMRLRLELGEDDD